MSTPAPRTLELTRARHCAWRALYLSARGRQLAHLGIDPTADGGPRLFAGAGGRRWRVALPYLRWHPGMGRVRLAIYRAQSRLLFALDGRT